MDWEHGDDDGRKLRILRKNITDTKGGLLKDKVDKGEMRAVR